MAQPTDARLTRQLEHPETTPGNVGQAGSGTQSEDAPLHQDHDDDHTHHVPLSTYYKVFAFLMVMLMLTVGAWYIDQHVFALGAWSVPIALIIAFAKAAAIVMIFMHVKYSSKLVQIFACVGLAFVSIMFTLTMNDYLTRGWTPLAGH
ncbi:cytochrome c oxidase subunit 4 [Abditibacterium utsteinense]|uniref:Cytochrome c oxidase subunit 4 n=1 Tax=Abditibacterium utsteinense TaxID=1960156 RepID=A0A2S8SUY3_9BACT|nr:cytochrome C oxidase subunit IV family protein [Abditibacterium utsteinense]PQV64617.1 cytochrome c oxidase subunit 4 [Abditibacterium utsteinense]